MLASRVYFAIGVLLIGAISKPLTGQTIISGRVRLDAGGPLGGAVVAVVGSHLGSTTDDAGRYRLSIPGFPLPCLVAGDEQDAGSPRVEDEEDPHGARS